MGPVLLDINALTLTQLEKEKIKHPNTGAVILFSRNYDNHEQISQLIKSIRDVRCSDILIAVDQEGGRVQRFKSGFTLLPEAMAFAKYDISAKSVGWLMAAELLAIGVDFSFAPVLDVDCGISQIIGNRSFSKNQQQVAQLANEFKNGMNLAGMAATGKHFPGHGGVALDSHLGLPTDNRDWETINSKDLLPFKQLILEGLEAIMTAHVLYPQIDSLPASFSVQWVQQILRTKLNFQGAIFSDDLSMKAAAIGDYTQRAKLALYAGCDMVLVCNNPEASEKVLDSIPITTNKMREQRLQKMLGKPKFSLSELKQTYKWKQISRQISRLKF